MQKLVIIGFLLLIIYNLGAGCYYMLHDKGASTRTVKSLSWRIGLSLALIVLIGIGIKTGYIQPHGVQQ
jgi:succinate dehydrogenase/fumarate reductase cytochrome b subunit